MPNTTGSDLNLRTTKDLVWWTDREQIQSATPLDVALRTHQPEKIKALLATGAKVATDDLFMLVKNNQAELFALLLQHVPDFSPNDPKASRLLEAAAKADMDVAPLIAKGAKPPADWLEAGFPSTQASILYLLQEAFLYPKLASDNTVWLIRSKWWNTGELRIPLADKSQNPELPSTAQALLDSDIASQLNFFNNDNDSDNDELETRWNLWRKNDQGKLTAIELDLTSAVKLPDLNWGDIVEVRTLGHPLGKPGVTAQSYCGKSNSTYWNLLRRISFPIQITRGEEITDLTVRGDCLSYDPTKPIVPLLPAGFLSKHLYPDEYHQALSKSLAVIVHRDGWDPIRLSSNTKEWLTFPLQANDRIAVDASLKDESVTRETFLDIVWGYHAYPSTRTVDNFIAGLRGKIELDPANPGHLITVRGQGYRLNLS